MDAVSRRRFVALAGTAAAVSLISAAPAGGGTRLERVELVPVVLAELGGVDGAVGTQGDAPGIAVARVNTDVPDGLAGGMEPSGRIRSTLPPSESGSAATSRVV